MAIEAASRCPSLKEGDDARRLVTSAYFPLMSRGSWGVKSLVMRVCMAVPGRRASSMYKVFYAIRNGRRYEANPGFTGKPSV
jgi:hypothetical protein